MHNRRQLSGQPLPAPDTSARHRGNRMRISIKTRNVECDEELRNYVNRRVAFALSRFADAVQRVEVMLEGQQGTTSQRCCFHVHVKRRSEPIECETTHTDLLAAIDLTSGRAGRTVARRLDLNLTPRASR